MGQLMQYVATNIRDGSTSAFFEKNEHSTILPPEQHHCQSKIFTTYAARG